MPVIECACGMVMSVPLGGGRAGCIRCGGADFHVLDCRSSDPAPEPFVRAHGSPVDLPGFILPDLMAGIDSARQTDRPLRPLSRMPGLEKENRSSSAMPIPLRQRAY
jgi:hypothetical protein